MVNTAMFLLAATPCKPISWRSPFNSPIKQALLALILLDCGFHLLLLINPPWNYSFDFMISDLLILLLLPPRLLLFLSEPLFAHHFKHGASFFFFFFFSPLLFPSSFSCIFTCRQNLIYIFKQNHSLQI